MYLDDFHYSEPAILFLGDERSLLKLGRFLRELGIAASTRPITLEELAFMRPSRNTKITVRVSEPALGMRRAAETEPASFTWYLSRQTARHFADLIDGVATSVRPSHNYLETDCSDDIVVVVSKGEYPTDMLRESHGP